MSAVIRVSLVVKSRGGGIVLTPARQEEQKSEPRTTTYESRWRQLLATTYTPKMMIPIPTNRCTPTASPNSMYAAMALTT